MQSNQSMTSSASGMNQPDVETKMDATGTNQSADNETVAIKGKIEGPQNEINKSEDEETNDMSETTNQPLTVNSEPISNPETKDSKTVPLDKFKRRLVRAVARHLKLKKPEDEMWEDLKQEIGCDCRMLWQHMRTLTLKKLKRLLPANDLLENLKKVARFTATDWLLFDLILVHEKVNVISLNDGNTQNEAEDDKEEPQCLHDLYELAVEHKVEYLSGDDLTEAWIRVTLQYNSSGRQCSPMLLQLRWYQIKEFARARFYSFWCAYRGNPRIIDRAMKFKPTALQTAIASRYKFIITQQYPEWEKLIEERRVILSEEFAQNREAKRKKERAREENEVEIEVIEPLVETIELEMDSDEERGNNDETKSTIKDQKLIDNNEKSATNIDNNKSQANIMTTIKSETDDDVLELDGLSDVEVMHIPREDRDENDLSKSTSEHSIEKISHSNEMLPKITNVIGNVVEPTEFTDERGMNNIIENDRNCVENTVMETIPVVNQSAKDTSTLDCNPLGEINESVPEKSNDLMSIEITHIKSEYDPSNEINNIDRSNKPSEMLHEKDDLSSLDNALNDNNIMSLDSDDELDKLVQEKANSYINKSQTNIEVTKENQNENLEGSEHVVDENAYANHGVNEIENLSNEEEIVEKEKREEACDEVDFDEIDDDQIEFVDDGIEFVEEIEGDKNKKTDFKTEPLSDSENESIMEVDNCHKIDLKLLMNPIVYTKKLDQMDIFKLMDFTYVNDEKAIECAMLESKPVDKNALKDEDIEKFRQQAIHGYESDGTQSEGDIVQTDEEYERNKVKCTSWLLQKPKKRSYNPIQLCKNPDFNTRLKRLTVGFLSLTRNRVLLNECKPLTIDLHKAFEKKLINGTMYLKSGDFKSANSAVTDQTNNEPVSVLPSVIPGQSIILTTNCTNNIISPTPDTSSNQDNNLPLTSIVDKHISNERNKTINLPDIDQVRRVNQSLLTAEVTPIRIESNIVNAESCENSMKETNDESVIVKPIALAPIPQIQNEALDSDLDDKTHLKLKLDVTQHERNSAEDVISNKINDQIINLSNQISEVVNNEPFSIDVEKISEEEPNHNSMRGRPRINNTRPSKPIQIPNKLTCIPRYTGKLTWSPKYPDNHIADSLLTLDTLSKILFLLNGNEEEIRHCACKQKKSLKEVHYGLKTYSKIKQRTTEQGANEAISALKNDNTLKPAVKNDNTLKPAVKNNNALKPAVKNNKKLKSSAKNVLKSAISKNYLRSNTKHPAPRQGRKKRTAKPRTYFGLYCCWARDKIIHITKNKHLDPRMHLCQQNCCNCCCREELITFTSWKSNISPHFQKADKNSSTIVLSDDEDKSNKNNKDINRIPEVKSADKAVDWNNRLQNIESATNKVTEHSEKFSLKLGISAVPPIINATVSIDPANIEVTSIGVQTEKTQQKSSTNASDVEKLSDNKKDILQNKKNCKTIVHAADGQIYNKRFESSVDKSTDQTILTTENTNKCIDSKYEETSKQAERVLFLNNSQMVNKLTRTPIYLGRNKVLLCSLKNPTVTETPVNPYLPVLPYGVHFVMLQNGELSLSIDNGINLDAEQLSTLPALMSVVQEQYLKSNISIKIPEHNSITKDKEHVEVTNENNVTNQNITNSIEDVNIAEEIQDKSKQNDDVVISNKDILSDDKTSAAGVSSPNYSKLDIVVPSNGENQRSSQTIMNTEAEHQKPTEQLTVAENKITESEPGIKNKMSSSLTTESLVSSAEPCLNSNSDDCENKNTNMRKSILSDLMEMSGISAEDTSMVTEVTNSCPPIATLPPTIIPVTRTSGSGPDMFNLPANSNVPKNISIAGPYSNLLSFEPNTPINQLFNYIAQIRPDLNAVTSFTELKYVCENNGQFYRLDVASGTISEIKVMIKKNPKSQIASMPKAFIDLTEDTCDSENVACAEFQDIPQDKQLKAEVKPIKLFRSVHPTVLNRSGRSILKESEVIYPKKAIHINKQKRKQLLHMGNKYVLVDVDKTNELKKPEGVSTSHLDSSYDSSDEEPLAKKRQRNNLNKQIEQNVEETNALFEDTPVPHHSTVEETIDVTDSHNENDEYGDASDQEISMDIEGVNPELHPVAFEEGSESDEDMCILGV